MTAPISITQVPCSVISKANPPLINMLEELSGKDCTHSNAKVPQDDYSQNHLWHYIKRQTFEQKSKCQEYLGSVCGISSHSLV